VISEIWSGGSTGLAEETASASSICARETPAPPTARACPQRPRHARAWASRSLPQQRSESLRSFRAIRAAPIRAIGRRSWWWGRARRG